MFTFSNNEDQHLQQAIDRLYASMQLVDTGSQEYAKITDQLAKLYALKETNSKGSVSADTLLTVLGNLLGILVIVKYERANVITSKALGFVMRAVR